MPTRFWRSITKTPTMWASLLGLVILVGVGSVLIIQQIRVAEAPRFPIDEVVVVPDSTLATTSLTLVPVREIPTTTPPAPVKPKPEPLPPAPQPNPPPTPVPPPPNPPLSNPKPGTVGKTTLVVGGIPLLTGGTVRAGGTVSISFLQITNVGSEGALLTGFLIKQNGSADMNAVIGLSTVDDKGGSRGLVGGTEGSTPFKNKTALAPTDAYFAPGEMKLFTIKATVARDVTLYSGTNLMIDVTGLETTASVVGSFPIRGTTWTIGE